MDHNIIHHTETVPVREPLTVEQADKLIEQYGDTFPEAPLLDWQKAVLRNWLAGRGPIYSINRGQAKISVRHALDRIEEARAHGLA